MCELQRIEARKSFGWDAWRDTVGEEYGHHWSAAAGHLRRRLWQLGGDAGKHAEMAWASALWLGRVLHELSPSPGNQRDSSCVKHP